MIDGARKDRSGHAALAGWARHTQGRRRYTHSRGRLCHMFGSHSRGRLCHMVDTHSRGRLGHISTSRLGQMVGTHSRGRLGHISTSRLCNMLALAVVCCNLAPAIAFADDPAWIARGRDGMVAADTAEASRCGADVLAAGGNAFDAAIATSMALGVTRPNDTGLGGGGFMVAYLVAQRRFVALDFREMAPAAATPERFAELRKSATDDLPPSVYGGSAAGVPGVAAAYEHVVRRYGTRPLAELAERAARLAESGFEVTPSYRGFCEAAVHDMHEHPALLRRFPWVRQRVAPGGEPPRVGERITNPELARTLRLIGQRGPREFYEGAIGAAIVAAVNGSGGALTPADLRGYRVVEREPLRVTFRGFEVVSMPPPSSGGVCIAQTLNILAHLPQSRDADEVQRSHLLVEAMRHAFADRARWLGDPDASKIPVAALLSGDYARRLAQRVAPDRAGRSEECGSEQLPDDHGTTHFCVADRAGNIVAWTETVNTALGSWVLVEPYGFPLNNQLDDFATEPGKPNYFGLVQGSANLVAPGRRPLSSMSPTIVTRDGRPILTAGASGGPRIISATLQVVLHVITRGRELQQAMTAPRLHHQWKPDELNITADADAGLSEGLRALGHNVRTTGGVGCVTAIHFLPDGSAVGASDPVKGGRPAAAPN
ncbi:MAG: Glutathione hydrolase proenzyme [Phycisphaerae bacterium]|nr:Glutathione hydrolase proenzyme [Phycisphaerae bacterium]